MCTRISRVLWLVAMLTVSGAACSPIFAQGRYPTNVATLQWGNVTGQVVGAMGISGDRAEKHVLVGGTEGHLYSANKGGIDVFVGVYSNTTLLNGNQFGTASNDVALDVDASLVPDGLSVVGGRTEGSLFGPNAGGNDVFFGVFSNAVLITSNQIGTASNDIAYAVSKQYGDNASIIVAGVTEGALYGALSGKADAFIGVYSNKYGSGSAAPIYTNQFGTSEDDAILAAHFAREDITGGVYGAVGYTEGSFGAGQTLTNKGGKDVMFVLFSDGVMTATNIIGSSADEEGTALVFDGDNNTYIVGYTKGSFGAWNGIVQANAGAEDAFLAKLNSEGAVVWTRIWGSATTDIATAVALDSSTNVYVVGSTLGSFDGQSGGEGSNRVFMSMFNKDGSKQWTRIFGTNVMSSIGEPKLDISASTNIYVFADTAPSYGATSNDLYLAVWRLVTGSNVTEAPILYSPLGTGVVSGTASPLFNWSVVPGANYYTLVIQGNFAGTYKYIGSNSFSVPFSSTEGIFTWYVKGYVSDAGEATPSSTVGTFTFADGTFASTPSKPVGVSPTGLILTNNPTIVWNNANNDATSYYVKITSNSTDVYVNRKDIVWQAGVTNFSLYCSNANLGTFDYTWKVIGSNNVGVGSNWSDSLSFSVFPYPATAPIVVNPTNGTVTNTYRPTFVWSNVQYADYYEVRYWASGGSVVTQRILSLTSMSLDVSGSIGYTNRVIDPLVAGATYYWSIRAVNSNAVGPWSTNNTDWTFTVPYPTTDPVSPALIYPTGTVTDTRSPVFSWAESWGAVGYLLSVNYATNPGIYVVSTNVSTINWSNNALRLANDRYYWRISAVGTNGVYSSPASEAGFMIVVTNDGSFTLSTNAVNATKGYGDVSSSSVSFDVINNGLMDLVYSNLVGYGAGASGWWSVDGQTGTVTAGSVMTLTSSIVSTGLPSGVYYATNAVIAPDATNRLEYVVATLSVTQQILTVTAEDKSKVYGQTNPVFTVTYAGFVAGESTNVLTALASAACTAGASTAVGSYPITVGGASAVNYVFNYVDGTLTITDGAGVSLTITVTPEVGGTTVPSVGLSTNIPAGTWYSISARPSRGYSFTNWSIVTGTAEIADQYSTNTTVKLDTDTSILATFRLVGIRSLPWLMILFGEE